MSLVPQVLKSLKTLPPFPLVAQRALLLLNQSEVSIQELVDIVKFDPAITANVLRISNSAFFGLRREIHSLHQALLLLVRHRSGEHRRIPWMALVRVDDVDEWATENDRPLPNSRLQ